MKDISYYMLNSADRFHWCLMEKRNDTYINRKDFYDILWRPLYLCFDKIRGTLGVLRQSIINH